MAAPVHAQDLSRTRFSAVDLGMLSVALIWGINASVVKSALTGWNPVAFNAIRFPLAALLTFAYVRYSDATWRLNRRDFWYVALLGLVGNGLYQWTYIEAISRTTASNTSLLVGISPLVVTLWGAVTGLDKVSGWLLAGTGVSVAGVSMVIAGGHNDVGFGSSTMVGDLIAVGAMLCWAAYTVYARPVINRVGSSLRVTAWAMLFGGFTNLLIGFTGLTQQDYSAVSASSWWAMLFSAAASLTYGYIIYAWAVKKVGGARTAIFINLSPLIAAVFAAIFLGERWSLLQWAGAILVVVGVTVAKLEPRKS